MKQQAHRFRRGLSAKLLGLTLAFIMLAEVLVFLPTIGRALQVYGEGVIIELERGVLAFEVLGPANTEETSRLSGNFTPEQSAELQMQLLEDAGWQAFAARIPGNRSILAGTPSPARAIDLRVGNPLNFIGQALRIMVDFGPPELLRLSGITRDHMSVVDIWVNDTAIRESLRAYAGRIFLLSLGISMFAAALVYLSLRRMIVRPIERLRTSLAEFAAAPHCASARVRPSMRNDEIGYIEAETYAMQQTVASTLQQKERLAALGSAVAQVNHDLRGMLSTALLLSDSLESSKDPRVAKAAPVLVDSIERAVELCSATLKFTKGADMAVEAKAGDIRAGLRPVVADWMARWPQVKVVEQVPKDMQALYDSNALRRILDNLARNAVEAGSPTLDLSVQARENQVVLSLTDTGHGIPPKAETDLFVPFKGSTKRDGTGLGVANAAYLAEAMGGALILEKTGPEGTVFSLMLATPVAS